MKTFRVLVVASMLVALVAACDVGGGSEPSQLPGLTTLAPVTTTTTIPPSPQTTVAPTLPPGPPAGICRSFEEPVVAGTVTIEEVTETSGMATSRAHPGVVWMHNDSGGGPIVYATTVTGDAMGRFELDASTFDWEDMALGPGPEPDRHYLYLGDIGDNFNFRPSVVVHRIAEPTPAPEGGVINDVEEITLVYPEPGHDAESLFVDPVTGALFVVTKAEAGGVSLIFRAPGENLRAGATVGLTQVGSFQLDPGLFVTSADIDATGTVILFRGYNEVWLWQRTDLDLTETFTTEPCRVPSTAEVQGEAIAFSADGYSYYTMSEGREPDINYVFSIFD